MIDSFERAVQELYFYEITGTAGGFQTALFDLMQRADPRNFDKLAKAFPHQAAALQSWQVAGDGGNDLFRKFGLIQSGPMPQLNKESE